MIGLEDAPITQAPNLIDDGTRAVLDSIGGALEAASNNTDGYKPKTAEGRASVAYRGVGGHHHHFFSPLARNRMLAEAEMKLRPSLERGEWDTIAVCGASGTTVGACLADRLGCDLMVVRKRYEGDEANSGAFKIGHDRPRTNYIFLDDLIASGATARDLLEKMRGYRPTWRLAGYYLYADGSPFDWGKIVPSLADVPHYRLNP